MPDPADNAETLLGLRWRKPLALITVIGVTVVATSTALGLARTLVQTEIAASQNSEIFSRKVTDLARAAWSTDAVRAGKEHETFDTRLTAHDAAIKELQLQGSETQRKLDQIIVELGYIKASIPRR